MKYVVAYDTSEDADLNNSNSQFEFCNEKEIKKLKGNFSVYKRVSNEKI
jgi:hypothetical protein